jgi:tetratricopeptide (TPR) repeat protein
VIGRSFDDLALRETSGRSEIEIIQGLETLLQRGLIVVQTLSAEAQSAPRYDFSHDKLRTFVYEDTSLARQRLLHQRAAEWAARLARQRREFNALAAQHYRQAGQLLQAADYYFQAGAYARSVAASHEALQLYQHALACGYPKVAVLHEAIGDVLLLQGNYLLALASYETAAAQCSLPQLPILEHKLGKVQHALGRWELAECHFQAALDGLLEGQDHAHCARMLADWSLTAYSRGETVRAVELAENALAFSRQCQDDLAVAQAQNMMGLLMHSLGDLGRARQHLECSLESAERSGDVGAQAAALNNLARLDAQEGRSDQALQFTQAALALCEKQGDRHRVAALHNNLADLYHAAGQSEAAMQHLKCAVVIFAEMGFQAGEAQAEIWKLAEW